MKSHKQNREDQPLDWVPQTFPSLPEGLAKQTWGSLQPLLVYIQS